MAFAAVAVSFSVATAYSQYRSLAIDRVAAQIAGRLAPGIQHLAAARAGLRHFQSLVSEFAGREDVSAPGDVLEPEWRQFDQEFQEFLALKPFHAEEASRTRLSQELTSLNQIIARLLAQGWAADVPSVRKINRDELRPGIEQLAQTALEVLQLDARRAREQADSIDSIRETSMWIAFSLDGVGIALTCLAGWLLLLWLKRGARVREAHRQLLKERADELEQFSARLAHDILGPISTAAIAIDYCAQQQPPQDMVRMLSRGRSALRRVRKISDALLEFARSGALPKAGVLCSVREVVAEVVDEIRGAAADANAQLDVGPIVSCMVACADGLVISLLSNLLRNAIKYLGEQPKRRIALRVLDRDLRVRFEVEDTGPGLPDGLEASVFEAYVRGPANFAEGIGLGLATVKRIAVAHGGRVGVRSSRGEGCLFWFELPKAAAQACDPADLPGAQPSP